MPIHKEQCSNCGGIIIKACASYSEVRRASFYWDLCKCDGKQPDPIIKVIQGIMHSRYNAKGWVLCRCTKCKRLNYIEPHGTTGKCACSVEPTEHENLR